MTNLTLAAGRPTLIDRVLSRGLVTDLVLIAAGAAFTSIAAQIAVPLWPVPMTMQTFAVLLVGTTLGAVRGALSMALYLVLGVAGLPVFSDAESGSLFALASGGYIVGFILAAFLVGWLAQRQWDRKVLGTAVSFLAGTVAIYAIGLPWLAGVTGGTLPQILEWGLYPFLIGDALKVLLAAALFPLSWRAVRKHDQRNDA